MRFSGFVVPRGMDLILLCETTYGGSVVAVADRAGAKVRAAEVGSASAIAIVDSARPIAAA